MAYTCRDERTMVHNVSNAYLEGFMSTRRLPRSVEGAVLLELYTSTRKHSGLHASCVRVQHGVVRRRALPVRRCIGKWSCRPYLVVFCKGWDI